MRTGDVIEAAIWVTGDESPEIRARYADDVAEAIAQACTEARMRHAPIQWAEKRPGEDRVPPVPDHVQGSAVRLLVAEAEVLGPVVASAAGSFVANLDRRDLIRLRYLTRRQAAQASRALSDAECDEIIEAIGPDAAVETLRGTVGTALPRALH